MLDHKQEKFERTDGHRRTESDHNSSPSTSCSGELKYIIFCSQFYVESCEDPRRDGDIPNMGYGWPREIQEPCSHVSAWSTHCAARL